MAHKIKCSKCNYSWTRRSTMNIARCPNCGGFQNLKKYPDRRFRKNRRRKEHSGFGASKPYVPLAEVPAT